MALPSAAASLREQARSWPDPILVHVYHQYAVIIIEQIIGAVAVMDIPVQDHHLRNKPAAMLPVPCHPQPGSGTDMAARIFYTGCLPPTCSLVTGSGTSGVRLGLGKARIGVMS